MKTTLSLLLLAAASVFAEPSVLFVSNENIHHVAHQFMKGIPPQVVVAITDDGKLSDLYLVQLSYQDWDGKKRSASMACQPNIVSNEGKRITFCSFRNLDANDTVGVNATVAALDFGEVLTQ